MHKILIHLHIPKCAGSSMEEWIWNSFEKDDIFIHGDKRKLKDQNIFYLFQKKAISGLIQAHHPKIRFMDILLQKYIVYGALVREPLEQVASHINYIKSRPDHPYYFPDSLESALSRNAPFFQWQKNLQCRYFVKDGNFISVLKWMKKRNVILNSVPKIERHILRLGGEMNVLHDTIKRRNYAIKNYDNLLEMPSLINYVESHCKEDIKLYKHIALAESV